MNANADAVVQQDSAHQAQRLATGGESDEDATSLRNFCLIALHQVLIRIGWIFKVESIVMPAFMDFIGGGPVLRGLLPVLNRFGFSVPPVLFARPLKLAPRKSRVVAATTFAMSLSFAALAGIWFTGAWKTGADAVSPWMPYVFLVLYGLFFCATGLNQLAAHTLQGKLIRPRLRGRLFATAIVVGAPLAILAATLLMPNWLAQEDGGFGKVFAVTGALFAAAAAVMVFVREEPDSYQEPEASPGEKMRLAWEAIVGDANCRRLAMLAAIYSTAFALFPHYQALGLAGANADLSQLVLWICVQNATTATIALVVGPLADRLGNRLALRLTVFGSAVAPMVALAMALLPPDGRAAAAWLMFAPLGFTPVTIRFLINYALEIAPKESHPRLVSAVGICLAAPVLVVSPAAGLLVSFAGFTPLFALGLAALLAAAAQTFRLEEPRKNR